MKVEYDLTLYDKGSAALVAVVAMIERERGTYDKKKKKWIIETWPDPPAPLTLEEQLEARRWAIVRCREAYQEKNPPMTSIHTELEQIFARANLNPAISHDVNTGWMVKFGEQEWYLGKSHREAVTKANELVNKLTAFPKV